MRGHIRQRGKRSWAVVLDLGADDRGHRRQRWHAVRGSRRDAERERTRLLRELQTGDYVEPARITVGQYLAQWLRDYARPKVASTTLERYEEIVRLHLDPGLGARRLADLRPAHIQAYYTSALRRPTAGGRDLSPTTVVHVHRVLHTALKQAVRWQLVGRNPADAVEPPRKAHHEARTLTIDETRRLLAGVEGTDYYLPVVLAVATGMRRGEIFGLRWSDVDLAAGRINVQQALGCTKAGIVVKQPKTRGSRRSLPLPAFALEALRGHRQEQRKVRLRLGTGYPDGDLVCSRPDGAPWSPDAFSSAFRKMIRRLDMPRVRFHDLRHSHATQLLQQGVHPKIVSERLGHSSISITLDTYSHVMPGMQEDAAEKLDRAFWPPSADAAAS